MSRVLIFGRRTQGKSTLAAYIAEQQRGGIAVFDPNGQFDAFPLQASEPARFKRLLDSAGTGRKRFVVYRPYRDLEAEFSEVARILWRRSHFAFLVDEAHNLQSPSCLNPGLEKLVRLAPDDLVLVQTMHRPADSAVLCRSLASVWCIFRTTEENDLEVIRRRCGRAVAEVVCALPPRHVLWWSDDDATYRVLTQPRDWFRRISHRGRIVCPKKMLLPGSLQALPAPSALVQ